MKKGAGNLRRKKKQKGNLVLRKTWVNIRTLHLQVWPRSVISFILCFLIFVVRIQSIKAHTWFVEYFSCKIHSLTNISFWAYWAIIHSWWAEFLVLTRPNFILLGRCKNNGLRGIYPSISTRKHIEGQYWWACSPSQTKESPNGKIMR